VNDSQQWSTTTFGNEELLPRVPLPTLEDTCARWLRWCEPVLSGEEYAATAAVVEQALAPQSPYRKLHAALAEYNERPGVHSWLDDFWASRYLGRRDRIALNANFFFLFADTKQSQVERAAGLITGALAYKAALDVEQVPPVLQKGVPLSMVQNKFLFSATRIPGAEQDAVRAPYSAAEPGPSTARHIVVFYQGNAVRLDVLDPTGKPFALEDLAAGLDAILKADGQAEIAVGSLTTKARAEWAASRSALLAHPANVATLDTIETALFCVSLEDLIPEDTLAASDHLLHGDSRNRWFDKAVTFIVFGDGRAGINIEHCGLDGTTVLSFVDAVLAVSDGVRIEQRGSAPVTEPVEFVLTDDLRADALAAYQDFAAYAANTATTTVSFETFGSNRAKQLKTSPDAFVQLAYQLAHQRSKGFVGATYESIATRQFSYGRTEAMRVLTAEIAAFVAAMDDPAAADDAKRAAFRAAAEQHAARAKECQSGRAPEQHLWELQWLQRRRGAELGVTEELTLFETPGWIISRDDYLSTSSAPSVNIQYFGFGMTSSKCIGIGYVLLPDRFNIYLSTPRPVGQQMHMFADNLIQAVAELQQLLSE
jgi:carnitine O-acetyltransferase